MQCRVPVTSIPLTSRDDLDDIASVVKMKDRETHYVRSRGFLVEQLKSRRVYKVGLERRVYGSSSADAEYFVIVEYVGRGRSRSRFDERPIVKDISMLYRFLSKDPLLKSG